MPTIFLLCLHKQSTVAPRLPSQIRVAYDDASSYSVHRTNSLGSPDGRQPQTVRMLRQTCLARHLLAIQHPAGSRFFVKRHQRPLHAADCARSAKRTEHDKVFSGCIEK